jgi:addiction module HigA family antidote
MPWSCTSGWKNNPPHPGEIIKWLCLDPLGITITDAAKALGISRKILSAILNGSAGSDALRVSINEFLYRFVRTWELTDAGTQGGTNGSALNSRDKVHVYLAEMGCVPNGTTLRP